MQKLQRRLQNLSLKQLTNLCNYLIKDKQELIITQPNTEQDQTSQEQTIKDLFQEFNSINQRSNEELQNLLQQVYQSLNNKQELDLNFDNFTSSPQLQYEDLIFLCLKIKEHFSYYPRPVQLLSVIELYNHNPNQGRLAQIFTGEGKTLIIALLAILLSQKKNSNVDVVTSSPVLATRDAEQLEEFYKKFQVSVSHNIGGSKKVPQGMLPCYNSKVIYGDPHSFQADILRHEYSERGTMGDRKQEYIIVDEVDSMLIDGNSNKTLLSFMCQECLIQIRYSDQSGMKYVRQNKTYQQNKKL